MPQLFHKGVKQAFMHINPFDPAAALPRIEHRAVDQRINRRIQIGVFHDIARIFAAQLQSDACECAVRLPSIALPPPPSL